MYKSLKCSSLYFVTNSARFCIWLLEFPYHIGNMESKILYGEYKYTFSVFGGTNMTQKISQYLFFKLPNYTIGKNVTLLSSRSMYSPRKGRVS